MKPIIGITADIDLASASERNGGGRLQLNLNYAQAIADAGGSPVVIPPQADPSVMARFLDGLVIPGGPDIDAREFGEDNHAMVVPVAPNRFAGEKQLFSHLDPAMPILGICYGCQFINVIQGGNLIQHLPDIVGHEEDIPGTLQTYHVEGDSQLSSLTGPAPQGQSWHHQAVKNLGKDLRVTARNCDGIVEALESTTRPWLIGVQWHPERTLESAESRNLFGALIEAARAYRATRS